MKIIFSSLLFLAACSSSFNAGSSNSSAGNSATSAPQSLNYLVPSAGFASPPIANGNWKVTLPVSASSYWGPTPPAVFGVPNSGYPDWSTIGSADVTNPQATMATSTASGIGSGNCNQLPNYNAAVAASATAIPITAGAYDIAPYNDISKFADEFYFARADGSVVFRAPSLGWSTTQCSGSNHSRSEMRELYKGSGGSWTTCSNDWDSTVGASLKGSLKVEAISSSPSSVKSDGTVSNNNQVTFAQIHGGGASKCGGLRPAFLLMVLRAVSGSYQVELNIFTDTTGTVGDKFILATGVALGDSIQYSLGYAGGTITTSIAINGGAVQSGSITETGFSGGLTIKNGYPNSSNPAVILLPGETNTWAGQPVHAAFGAYHAASVPNYSPSLVGNGDESRVVYQSFSVTHP